MAKVLAPIIFQTPRGTPYLREAGVVLVGNTSPNTWSPEFQVFLHDLDPEFGDYANDSIPAGVMSPAEDLIKMSGQLCYQSFGPKRTKNADAKKYFANILQEGHGSILEHASLSFLVYGISRACSHEMVRHRHQSPSQLSQRFVGANRVRFVMHPGLQGDDVLERSFQAWIDLAVMQYQGRLDRLNEIPLTQGTRDARKWRMQSARMCLPNETETMMVLTGNLRAWRSWVIRRGALAADAEIRRLALRVLPILKRECPNVVQDMEIVTTDAAAGEYFIESDWGHV